jgi:hypothetical protein
MHLVVKTACPGAGSTRRLTRLERYSVFVSIYTKFELTDQTRQAVDDYLKASGKKPGEFLFTVGPACASA